MFVKTFGPNWFTVNMGTGILALALAQAAAVAPFVAKVGIALWIIDIVLFVLFSVLLTRRIVYDRSLHPLLDNPPSALLFGAVPMGLATIVNGFIAFGAHLFGPAAVTIATGLWWVDAVLSIACGLVVAVYMFSRQKHALETLSPVWLLPFVPCEVAAASAGTLMPHVAQPTAQMLLGLGLVLWALSVPLALSILALVFLRLALHQFPGKDLGASGWLALGPLGTGALALVLLGNGATAALSGTQLAQFGIVLAGIGYFGGLVLWAYGAWWWAIGIVGTLTHLRTGLPFNMGWWAFTFPLGVYTAATFALSAALHVGFFYGLALAFTVLLAVLWAIVAYRTAVDTLPKIAPPASIAKAA